VASGPIMIPANINFLLICALGIIQGLGYAVFYLMRSAYLGQVQRIESRLDELTKEGNLDASNLETWKMAYVQSHGELVGRVSALEAPLHRMELDMRLMLPQMAVIVNRLDTIERIARQARDK
jgi:hypothetical protein